MRTLPRADAAGPARADVAAAQLAVGRAVLLVHDPDAERSSLVLAAQLASPASVAFLVRHTSGFLCASLTDSDCDRLDLPPMVGDGADDRPNELPFAVSVDARFETTTGISARDRALTFNTLADPTTVPNDLTRPGHVVPMRARSGGVLEHAGRAEATTDLCRLAGLRPAAVVAELVSDTGAVPTAGERERFCAEHGIVTVSIGDVIDRRRCASTMTLTGRHLTDTPRGTLYVSDYRAASGTGQYLALRYGELACGEDVLVAVHAECIAGDVFASHDCTCGYALDRSLDAIRRAGRGLLVYLRARDGLEIRHQNLDPGRDLAVAAELLAAEGVRSVRLLADGPATAAGLERHGVRVIGTSPLAARLLGGWPQAAPSSA
jgi:3,4-dihydroxy 2-butanone 4-phosphate synthase / GTP cyclohydrolase II